MKQKAIFLDRDGVINHAIIRNGKPYPPATLAELTIPEDAQSVLLSLKSAGFLLIGATNQPDVARGKTPKSTVEQINAKLMDMLPIDEILVCYHDDCENCDCRKPKPGLLLFAAAKYQLRLEDCYMIGDRWRDIEAGQKAHCKTIWLNYQYAETEPVGANFMTNTLTKAMQWILNDSALNINTTIRTQ